MSRKDRILNLEANPTAVAPSPAGITEGAESPALLGETVSPGRLKRNAFWALLDRLAFALADGRIDRLAISVPPQHGKTSYWGWLFPAWWLGRNPDHRIVLCSYAAQYAAKWGRRCRDLVKSHGERLGGLKVREDVWARNEWELRGREGGMFTSGFEGGISGRSAELAILDDPFADQAAASSAIERERVWDFYESELAARLQKGAKMIVVSTRRHPDDLIGRLLELDRMGKEPWTYIKLPALAEEDEDFWGWRRKAGEALVPELHDAAELERTKLARGSHVWSALYQQCPVLRGGGDIKSSWFHVLEANPAAEARCRAWDLAFSESPKAKRTAGVLVSRRRDGSGNRYHIEDAVAGRWGPGIRNQRIVNQARLDGHDVAIAVEEEPGSGGLAQVDELVRMLDGFRVVRIRAAAGGSKVDRAMAMAAQAQAGNFSALRAPWTSELFGEIDGFPDGGLIDMVDALAHGYNFLASHARGVIVIKGPVSQPMQERLHGTGKLLPFSAGNAPRESLFDGGRSGRT